MKLLRFTARCQKYDVKTQYEVYGCRMFDLRVRYDECTNKMILVHGAITYGNILYKDLHYLDEKGDTWVRVCLDVRTSKAYSPIQQQRFKEFCERLQSNYDNIKFVGGDNLYNHKNEYDFGNYVSTEELYSSVTAPKLIDDWFPWLYARLHNKKNVSKGTDKDVLLIDFVNIQ